jgi:hypothetical protein
MPARVENHGMKLAKESVMSKGKGGGFKGHNAKTGPHQPIPHGPQTRRPVGTPVMRIAPRGKSGAKGR